MKKLIIANWKSYLSIKDSKNLFAKINKLSSKTKNYKLIIGANTSSICCLKSKKIDLAAQNVYSAYEGAYTGSLTVNILKELDIKYCIVGHSERRIYQKESNKEINEKIKILLKYGITPIFCFGDSEIQYKKKQSYKVVKNKINNGLKGIDKSKVIYAYEPRWAISGFKKGDAASIDFIQEMHQKIRKYVRKKIKLLYGGSIEAKNVFTYLENSEIDGLLVGKASTKIDFYKKIVR